MQISKPIKFVLHFFFCFFFSLHRFNVELSAISPFLQDDHYSLPPLSLTLSLHNEQFHSLSSLPSEPRLSLSHSLSLIIIITLMLALLASAAAAVTVAVVLAAVWATQRVPRWDFSSTHALITGGSVGIGLETARCLVRRNVRTLVIAARREEPLRAAVADLEACRDACGSRTRVHYVVMDVADEASVRAGVAAIEAEFLPAGEALSLLVCNAGFAHPARFMDSTPADARRMMDVNYFGCLHVLWAVLPGMLRAGRGRVVLTSSMVARAPIAGYALYAATKAGMRAFAHSLDMENSCLGVRVQVASPPDVQTPGYDHENEVKSPECAAISAFGGATPFTAAAMGEAIARGIARYAFDITLGSDGFFLSLGSGGMEPATSVPLLLGQTVAGGVLRLALAVMSKLHYGIVKKIRRGEREASKAKAA